MGQNVHVAIQEGNNAKLIKPETSVLDRKTVKICVMLIKNIKLQVRLSKYTRRIIPVFIILSMIMYHYKIKLIGINQLIRHQKR